MQPSSNSEGDPMFVSPIRVLRTSGKVKVKKDISHLALIYEESESAPELVLDYGRCEGGFPVFDITSVSAPDGQSEVTFKVTYSETIEGIDDEHGDGPFFLFSNAMDCYRVCTHHARVSQDTQTVKSRFIQASQRYQKITLIEPNTSLVFSRVAFLSIRPQAALKAKFRCSDETINRIWRDGVRTVDMCTVEREETVPAWEVVDEGTRVFAGHWAPCRQGTRWSDKKVTFQAKVEECGASWAVRMITNGLIFCLDTRSRRLSAVEGLADQSCIIPSIKRGSWELPEALDLSGWLTVETLAVNDSVSVSIQGQEVATVTGIHVKAMLGDRLDNAGSVALGGPPGWTTLYRDLLVKSLDGQTLYQNSMLPRDAERTFADFQVGTNKFPCIIDGAKRDRACFGGDVFVTGRSLAYSTANLDAWKGSVELLLSHQNKDGYLGNLCPIQAPEHTGPDEPPYYGHYSLTYALLLVVSIKDYWMHSGDRALVNKIIYQLQRQIDFTKSFLNSDGLVDAPPYLSMTWFPMGGPIFGVSTGLNLAYLDALNAMALMSPDREIESMYSSQATSLRETIIRVLWNAEHGTMRPALSLEADVVFQDVNAYAATLGVSPHDSRTAENIFPFDESLPSAFRSVDKWNKFGLASPYASGFALEALFAKNEGERAKDLLFKVWGVMANQDNPNYSGAHWEAIKTDGTPFNHDVSLAHGWSTWPVFLLPRYLAGVYPLEAGWKKIGVTPVLAGLDMVEYSLETPQGYVRVCLHIDKPKKTGVIKVLIPEGTTAVVKAPNGWTLGTEGLIQGDGTEVSVKIWG
ncbi:Six-hairpin glycosidase-like protein [Fusarium tricinctum]|uniref:Six-hairpin glycosidase-like protein n=1 Tax=Fusarium tricinctum TaxID=61284 RepID=A0A8K0S3Y9_9HYPO|nr:Six-hairpin glycosidase-like protein [Fusarium tricinctum]